MFIWRGQSLQIHNLGKKLYCDTHNGTETTKLRSILRLFGSEIAKYDLRPRFNSLMPQVNSARLTADLKSSKLGVNSDHGPLFLAGGLADLMDDDG